MVEVTQADMVAAEAQAKKHYQTAYDYEMDLREAFATHRQQAAKAERDRIVAWLRSDGPDRDNGGPCRHVEHSQGTCICNELADALESQP